MDSKRLVLLAVAVVAIGIFALPSTVSLFSGQHSWYGLSAGPNDVPCEKCHAEIKDEMGSDENGAHRELTCAMCHRTPYTTTYDSDSGHYEEGISRTYASGEGSGSRAGKEVHAAATIECMDCHAAYGGAHNHKGNNEPEYVGNCGVGICHYSGTNEERRGFIAAGGFGLTLHPLDNGSKAAHTMFVLDAINESLMEGANEACIACHTRIGVNITWTKKVYLKFTAEEDEFGNWTIPGFAAGGENVTHVNSSNEWTNP